MFQVPDVVEQAAATPLIQSHTLKCFRSQRELIHSVEVE